jgi:hypothetical protein
MIESYSFGRIVIDKKLYTTDVIVFPDRVEDKWWRKKGHKVYLADIGEIFKENPETLVVGTGYIGRMKVLPETKKRIESAGVQIVIEKTREACKTYNQLSKSKKTVAALHITC